MSTPKGKATAAASNNPAPNRSMLAPICSAMFKLVKTSQKATATTDGAGTSASGTSPNLGTASQTISRGISTVINSREKMLPSANLVNPLISLRSTPRKCPRRLVRLFRRIIESSSICLLQKVHVARQSKAQRPQPDDSPIGRPECLSPRLWPI